MYGAIMDKREVIEEIMRINHTARPEFLSRFKEEHLIEYLRHLREIALEHYLETPVFCSSPPATVEENAGVGVTALSS